VLFRSPQNPKTPCVKSINCIDKSQVIKDVCILKNELSVFVVDDRLRKVLLLRQLLIEVLQVVANLRLVRRLDLLRQQLLHVQAREKRVGQHLLEVALGS